MLVLISIWLFSDGNGGEEFIIASKDLIGSTAIPQQVKPIFQEFIEAITNLKPCVDQPDLQCLLNAFENIGVKGMEQAANLSHGTLQQLCQEMLGLDRRAVDQMKALPKNAGPQAAEIADFVFHLKANWVQQYLQSLKV